METILCFLFAVVVAYAAAEGYGKGGPRCYNCNYSNREAAPGYYPSGTSICALDQATDYERVDRWPCKSGVCFIRQDKNGLIYRGCGNAGNFPYGVSSDQQCLVQRYTGSVWWFCEGDLCNNGTIGNNPDRCQDAIVMQEAMTTSLPNPPAPERPSSSYLPPTVPHVPEVPVPVVPVRPVEPSPPATYVQNYVEEVVHTAPPPAPRPTEPRPTVPRPTVPRPTEPRPTESQQTYSRPTEPEVNVPDVDEPTVDVDLPNPCDGKCGYNPSGLFEDPRDPSYFIQCGAGYGCTCCKPYYLRCALGTRFDKENDTCTSIGGGLVYREH